MSIFSSISSGLGGIASKIGSYASNAVSKAQTAAIIAGTNVKNSFSVDSLQAFVDGYKKDGLVGAIANASAQTTASSINELEASSRHHDQIKDMLSGLFEQQQAEQQAQAEYDDTVAKMQNVINLQKQISGSTVSNTSSGEVPYIAEPSPKDGMMKIAAVFALLKLAKVF